MFHSMMFTTSRGALFCAFFCLFFSRDVATISALRFVEDDFGSKLSSEVLVPRSARMMLAVGAMKFIATREIGRGLGPAFTDNRLVRQYVKTTSSSGQD